MIIVDIAAAAAIGTLSGMGIGGGGLLVIYLTLVRGVGQLEAQGMNLYFFIFASAAALYVHIAKRKINYPLILLTSSVGMLGAYGGSALASVTDPELIRRVFGAMLLVSGGISLFRVVSAKRRT